MIAFCSKSDKKKKHFPIRNPFELSKILPRILGFVNRILEKNIHNLHNLLTKLPYPDKDGKPVGNVTFDLLFEFFGLLDYDIDLSLFDYSCSGFNSEIIDHPNYYTIMDDDTIAKGGNQTVRRKRKIKIRKSQKKQHKHK